MVGIVTVLILGHWSLILQGMRAHQLMTKSMLTPALGVLLEAIWTQGVGCTTIDSNITVLAATFVYSMIFDLAILCLTAYKLSWTLRISGTSGRSHGKLLRMVFFDGLVYFVIAYVPVPLPSHLSAHPVQLPLKLDGHGTHDHQPGYCHECYIQCSGCHSLDGTPLSRCHNCLLQQINPRCHRS